MIRKMTVDDIKDVQQIALTSWRYMFGEYIPEEVLIGFIDRTYSDLMLKKQIEKTTVLLAIDPQGLPVGYISYTPIDIDGESEVTALHMLPSHLNSGYEELLLAEALQSLSEAQNVDVYVDERSHDLQAFYVNQGFVLVESIQEEFEGLPVETLHYTLQIKQHAHT
ncbi:GNAT family N-acetyltransferase [Sporosarcina sp. GW1-11]|uniref:GNAT family N-acetyltransferase n=1 Tax=Sporosarcina sp. GW1-11 TaxID=2899126 RepID=UPI00294BCFEF|nr:GNAT family N-acetyltransferase [Sporosarcina sp. GW1-11]MDV6378495.1 GNAT family N-acetyltransferase [Sporosarcina sp. GW1-11]